MVNVGPSQLNPNAIKNKTITNDKIVDGTIDSTALADDAVTTAKIVDAAVTEAKLHADVVAQLGGGATSLHMPSGVLVTNTTTETDIVSYTVAANTLGNNDILHYVLYGTYLNNSGSNKSITIKVYYNTTAQLTFSSPSFATNAAKKSFKIDIYVGCRNNASVKFMGASGIFAAGGDTIIIAAADATYISYLLNGVVSSFSESNTNSNVFKVSVQHSAASVNTYFDFDFGFLEHIPGA